MPRWPVLMVAAGLLVGAVTSDAVTGRDLLGASLLTLGSACVGAFLYAEGVRDRAGDDDDPPQDLRP